MATQLVAPLSDEIERVLLTGDLGKLTPDQRLSYYNRVCESLELNPLTKPFLYLSLNGKLVLYASKDCTEQLRNKRAVSVRIVARESVEGCYVVTAQASLPSGRCDESIGAVPIDNLKGEARSNAIMKAETKAKRRVTLSICGLGMLDESEVSSIPGAHGFDDGGSKEAQQEVKDRRITELKAQAQLPPATPSATIIELADSLDAPPADPNYEERQAKIKAEADEALKNGAAKTATRKKGTIPYRELPRFKQMKDEMRKLVGDDSVYYDILKLALIEHADQLNEDNYVKVYKLMGDTYKKLKSDGNLKADLAAHRERIGGARFLEVLGGCGFESLEHVISEANGQQVQAVLDELKAAQ